MKTSFNTYVWQRMPIEELVNHVFEVSTYFPKVQINQLFQRQTNSLLHTSGSEEQIRDLLTFRDMDHVGYIDKAARNAGFKEPDLDPIVQDVVVKLLMGSLFSNYQGQPMVARFKVAVTNALRTVATRRIRFKKRSQPLDKDVPQPTTGSAAEDTLVGFRNYVRRRVGPAAVSVLDQRLSGGETKHLLGTQGVETSYRLKQVVTELKAALRDYAKNDPEFQAAIERAMADEQRTIDRRFRHRVPRPLGADG